MKQISPKIKIFDFSTGKFESENKTGRLDKILRTGRLTILSTTEKS